jgi:pyruvate dehydrogenase E2 component (dihydrolipoamide acetyltransferase)
MITKIIMPKLGDTMDEGVLCKWLKKEGDKVEKGEAFFEVTTDKANLEAEASKSGFVRKLIAKEGDKFKVTEVIAYVADSMDEPLPVLEEKKTKVSGVSAVVENKTAAVNSSPLEEGRVNASPIAKRLAKEKGIDISKVKGTGPGGRILEKDITDYKPGSETASAAPAGAKVIPLSGIRKVIAQRLSKSKQEIPHFYLTVEVDMTALSRIRALKVEALEKQHGIRVSINDFVVYAVAKALKAFPLLNSLFENLEIRQFDDCNIGFAVSLENGLVVPVIKKADKKTVVEIAKESKLLSAKAKENKLSPEDMAGGTFTISNMGMLKVDEFSAIINPPQVAIVAVGAVKPAPVVIEDKIVVRSMMKMTISADHRAVDGAYAAAFMNKVKEILQAPEGINGV